MTDRMILCEGEEDEERGVRDRERKIRRDRQRDKISMCARQGERRRFCV